MPLTPSIFKREVSFFHTQVMVGLATSRFLNIDPSQRSLKAIQKEIRDLPPRLRGFNLHPVNLHPIVTVTEQVLLDETATSIPIVNY
ncbi:hypothetical protein PBY51_019886 [Eleginops maclovinus]|nr:hypothetical protein PBY51_019886 [Eleginops maclovinus]